MKNLKKRKFAKVTFVFVSFSLSVNSALFSMHCGKYNT